MKILDKYYGAPLKILWGSNIYLVNLIAIILSASKFFVLKLSVSLTWWSLNNDNVYSMYLHELIDKVVRKPNSILITTWRIKELTDLNTSFILLKCICVNQLSYVLPHIVMGEGKTVEEWLMMGLGYKWECMLCVICSEDVADKELPWYMQQQDPASVQGQELTWPWR